MGRVDFFVCDANWAIGCVRDGSRPDEHVQRFLPGGTISSMDRVEASSRLHAPGFQGGFTKKPKQYVGSSLAYFLALILTTDVDYGVPWLYHIVFSRQSDTFEVYDFKLTKQEGPTYIPNRTLIRAGCRSIVPSELHQCRFFTVTGDISCRD